MSIIDDILSRIDIVDIVEQYVDLKKSWNNFIWLCPFHNEKTPSFVVSPDKQIFKCFWCWKWWNVITFIKEIENVEFYDAIKLLAEKSGIDIKNYKSYDNNNLDIKEQILSINKTALNFFHSQIFENNNAMKYLINERHLNKEIILKYKLWFAPKDSQLLVKYLRSKWFNDETILKSWLWKKTSSGSIYSFFVNRIIFPIFNNLWNIVAFSGRIFDKNTWWWKYINTPETIIYHKSHILYNYNNAKKTKKDFIIVCEWYMDVIWLYRLWFDNSVATCWTALTKYHIASLKRITNNIIFAFDGDEAWKQASFRWLKIALEEWVFPKIFNIENWKDFDELANKIQDQTDFSQLLEDQFKNSEDWITFFINEILKDYEKNWPTEKQEKLLKVFEIIKEIWNYSIFWNYIEKIWKIINQDPHILYQQLKIWNKYKKNESPSKNSNEFIIPSLFYNEFFNKLWFKKEFENYIWIILQILDYLPEINILKKVFTENLTDNEKEKILEKQLRREKTLDSKKNKELKNKVIKEVKMYLIQQITILIKNPKLNNKDKNILILNLNKIRK